MVITRRSVMHVAATAGATATALGLSATISAHQHAAAMVEGDGTPVATPAPIAADELVSLLRSTPIDSPLFPRDAEALELTDWVDDNDEDLRGTLAGFMIQDTTKGDGDESFIGAYIVHPTAAQATERFVSQADGDGIDLFGRHAAWMQAPDGYSLIAVVEGPVIVSAFAGSPPAVDAPAVTDFRETDARALSHLAGLLDHLRIVSSGAA